MRFLRARIVSSNLFDCVPGCCTTAFDPGMNGNVLKNELLATCNRVAVDILKAELRQGLPHPCYRPYQLY